MVTSGKSKVLVVGSVAFDSVETPERSVERALGGSATFGSMAASYFSKPQVVAVVGEDFSDEHLGRLEAHGIDTGGIERVAGRTFHWKGRYHTNMQDRDTLDTQLNVFEGFDPVLPSKFQKTSFIFLGNIDPRLQIKVLSQVGETSFVAMDTMNFWISSALEPLQEILRRVDMLFINDEEAFQLSGERQVLTAGEKILAMGPEYVVIKRGEFGSLLFGREVCIFVPAVLLPRVVDPTGAGDAFAGGFVGYLSREGTVTRRTLAQAMLYGTVMASFAVEDFSIDAMDELKQETIDLRREFIESMTNYRE